MASAFVAVFCACARTLIHVSSHVFMDILVGPEDDTAAAAPIHRVQVVYSEFEEVMRDYMPGLDMHETGFQTYFLSHPFEAIFGDGDT